MREQHTDGRPWNWARKASRLNFRGTTVLQRIADDTANKRRQAAKLAKVMKQKREANQPIYQYATI